LIDYVVYEDVSGTVGEKKMEIPIRQANGFVDEVNRQLTQQILQALQEIRYGSVEIVIHDSKVVQIERKEKIRIDTYSSRATK
jgi:hypothetical protein